MIIRWSGFLSPISKHREELEILGEAEHFLTTFVVFQNRRKTSVRVFELTTQIRHYFAIKSQKSRLYHLVLRFQTLLHGIDL